MKKILYIIAVALIALILAGGIWLITQYLHPAGSTNQTPYTNPYSYPSGTSNGITNTTNGNTNTSNGTNNATPATPPTPPTTSSAPMSILLQNGKSILVKDFIHNGETVPDTVNPGSYYLAGSIGYCLGNGTCPSGYKTNDFTITYYAPNGHFNIVILTDSLATIRTEAESFLLDRVGVTEAQLCNTNYWIGSSVQVDPTYGGKNLGFSFCPGAMQL